MSTSYYALRNRLMVSSRRRGDGLHSVYDEVGELVAAVRDDYFGLLADRDVRVAHRSGGVIVVTDPGPDDQPAISEYGELVTLGQLRRGEAP